MDLLWPGFLVLLVLVPLLAGIYIWLLRRRRRFTVRYSSLSLVRESMSRQARWKRHVPVALFLAAVASLALALTRPVTIVSVPTDRTTILLTIDVSRSMCSTDIEPSRLEAAQAAATAFIQRQGARTMIGVVAFSGFAEIIQPPTTDVEVLQSAVDSLATGRRTAIGSGLLKAIDAIAEIDPAVAPALTSANPDVQVTPVPHGAYVPDIVVLLTDGVSNVGPTPLDAAQQAADRGVRVYTIGFGTAGGASFPPCGQRFIGREPFSGGGGQFGGGGGGQFGSAGFRRGIDEDTLREVADLTGGEYYSAESAGELNKVFEDLPTYLITKHETTEVSVIFAAVGALCALAAMVLSQRWQPLP